MVLSGGTIRQEMKQDTKGKKSAKVQFLKSAPEGGLSAFTPGNFGLFDIFQCHLTLKSEREAFCSLTSCS